MLEKHQKAAALAVLIGAVALLGARGASGEEPEPVEARGIIADVYETDEGEEVLVLETDDSTLTLHVESTTEVWYGETQATPDLLWDELESEAEVEYVVIDGRSVLRKIRVLSDVEE